MHQQVISPDSIVAPPVIRRERDAVLANRICNDPEILKVIARHGHEVDCTPAVRSCVILSNGEDAVQIYEQTEERHWQVMTVFADTCRGKRALETGRAMRDWMLPAHADLIFGSIPNNLRHALWFYRQLGGRPVESVESNGTTYFAQPNETLFEFRGNA